VSIEAGRPHLSFACILDREVWQAETAGFRGEVGELNCADAVQHDFRLAVNTNVEQTPVSDIMYKFIHNESRNIQNRVA